MPDLEKPITTEEELEQAVQAAIGQRCPDYDDLKERAGKLPGLETENAGLKAALLRVRVAHEVGLPHEFAQRITGEDEAAMRKDAESMRKFLKPQTPGSPLFNPEPAPGAAPKGFGSTKHTPKVWPTGYEFD